MNELELEKLASRLISSPKECEWLEFKHNFKTPEELGEYISALSNGACLTNQTFGYLVFGIEDKTHNPIGTTFKPKQHKVKEQELENWLYQRLSPRIEFEIYEFVFNGFNLCCFKIYAAQDRPVRFLHNAYVRIGSIKRELKDFPEKERKIWTRNAGDNFQKDFAIENVDSDDIIQLLDINAYYDLMKLPYPQTTDAAVDKFIKENLVVKSLTGYNITNMAALLFAKRLSNFDTIKRKGFRIIQYSGKNKIKTLKDTIGQKGYAAGFDGLLKYINSILPSNEQIGLALRDTEHMYPTIAIRELVANAIIHQDLRETGTAPVMEIFEDRIEITNPGVPLISSERFIDEYQSRNEDLASFMRRLRICEEKGSGIDKVIFNIELYQLPPLDIQIQERHTKVVMYAHKATHSTMHKKERIRACYQHACLKFVANDQMTNQSLRARFKISGENAAIATRIIKETLDANLIKEVDPENKSRRFVKYTPWWA